MNWMINLKLDSETNTKPYLKLTKGSFQVTNKNKLS